LTDIALCSDCFRDQGLHLDAKQIGIADDSACPSCGSRTGKKLNPDLIKKLAHRFFVRGTLSRCDYGAAPLVVFNEHQSTCISTSPWFEVDLRLIEKAIGVGFFYYGPRLWMVGEVEPLKSLQDLRTRATVIKRIIAEYPAIVLQETQVFYRIRKNPSKPDEVGEYDSPPSVLAGLGRLDSPAFPVMYGSQDLQVCVHECRVTAEDELYMATLAPTRELRLLDLTELLLEEKVTEFESLDMAVHMLFLAGAHSYEIAREIAREAHGAGYDGLVYPSYFSLLRTGGTPFETSYGISHRTVPHLANREKAKIIRNLAIFGRPIEQNTVVVRCINRLIMTRVAYDIQFGPVGC
jgi:RES domain